MARMMPPYCPDDAPPGEKALYRALAAAPDTEGWIVLHSLALANHVRQVEGEADFVVIVPNAGVLVIEVKSHKSVRLLGDGRWKLGNDAPTGRGPFQQAREAMYSILSFLQNQQVSLTAIPVLHAVWFTHVRARTMLPQTPEWHPWQVLDSGDLKDDAPAAILRTLKAGRAHLDEKTPHFRRAGTGPDQSAAGRIATQLRPRFEMHVVPADLRQARESQLVTFIEEQYRALDAMADNQAVLFTGPAGSGKTLLAVEAAQREQAQGGTGRLLCFNRLLGRRLSDDLQHAAGLATGTFHQEMLRIARVQPPLDAGRAFWEQELPDLAVEALLDGDATEVNDFLVIDEIQDIAREPYLDVLDLMVEGGLENGRLLLFGDFERQAIFEMVDGRDILRDRCTRLVYNRLTENCRNLPRIGHAVNLFSKLDPGYDRFRRQDDGVDPVFVRYRAGRDQSPRIVEAVHKLRDEGYKLNEIVVLSPLASGSSSETTEDQWLRQVLHPADGRPPKAGQLQYCTIHAFKGLEAPAIVVTDLDQKRVPNFESLLYVGMTRATDRLVIVIESETLRAAVGGTS